ncbi:MAG: hypothetical protein EBU16_04920 [Actinobacteria bacterium]|jgi:hypothetical protein|nr:hypothetical protein [Actinomycetota bacterium]
MSDTIKTMEYAFVDVLNVDQLMVDDLVKIEDDIVQIIGITSLSNGYAIGYQNDFGERDIVEVDDYEQFDLYVLIDD